MRTTLCCLAAAAVAAFALPSITQAAPMRVTFTDCGLYVDCIGPKTVMSSFDTPDTIYAPNVPPPQQLSVPDAVAVDRMVAGIFSGLYIRSFNLNNLIGSEFIFQDAIGADGFDYPMLTLIAAFRVADLHLKWTVGDSVTLGRFTCLNSDCSFQSRLQSFVRLDLTDIPTASVPEPMSASLVAAALGAGWFARRRRAAV